MSARESIENLWDRATPVGPLLDAYAHELAEKIRAETRALKDAGVLEPDKFRPCRDAANQIDPEVSDGV